MENRGIEIFSGIYKNKRVLVTGHTGFKGTWLTTWLLDMGATVCGISKDFPTQPSMFEELGLKNKIDHHICDVRDYPAFEKIVASFKPDFVFHLAAQAIVSKSYVNPLETISTNVLGTAHVLECLRNLNRRCNAVIITSDKCYENVEWHKGYKETDRMGGKDIYSGSKGAAELIFRAFQQSFFGDGGKIRLATGRAGNVIGGGDWAQDRIVADCVRAWHKGEAVEIRSPEATRPWQHVLEPLSGYLTLGQQLVENEKLNGEQFNFGPKPEQNHTVRELLDELSTYWGFEGKSDAYRITDNIPFNEAGLLRLDCKKALSLLNWQANLVFPETIKFVSEWYYTFYKDKQDMFEITTNQIHEYVARAKQRGLSWTV